MPRVKEIRQCKKCERDFHRSNGNVKAKYCSVLCARRDLNTKEHQSMAGKIGGQVTANKIRGTGTKGYIKRNQRHEHRTIMEQKLGRKLKKGEIVHHIDENKHNNKPENLKVMTRSKHIRIHIHKKL